MAIDLHFLNNVCFDSNQAEDNIAEMLRVIMMPWLYFKVKDNDVRIIHKCEQSTKMFNN